MKFESSLTIWFGTSELQSKYSTIFWDKRNKMEYSVIQNSRYQRKKEV